MRIAVVSNSFSVVYYYSIHNCRGPLTYLFCQKYFMFVWSQSLAINVTLLLENPDNFYFIETETSRSLGITAKMFQSMTIAKVWEDFLNRSGGNVVNSFSGDNSSFISPVNREGCLPRITQTVTPIRGSILPSTQYQSYYFPF